jgi:hypothetical protein
MRRKEGENNEDGITAVLLSEAIKHPRVAAIPFFLIETGVGAIKGGSDMAGYVAGGSALILAMSGLFKRVWWSYAGVVGMAGYLAEQPMVPVVTGALVVGDLFMQVGHIRTGLNEKD